MTMTTTLNTEAALAKHRSSRASHYPFLLVFVREFTHGTSLVGVRQEDTLPFSTRASAEEWVAAINAKNAKHLARDGKKDHRVFGSQTYRVVEHAVVDVCDDGWVIVFD